MPLVVQMMVVAVVSVVAMQMSNRRLGLPLSDVDAENVINTPHFVFEKIFITWF